MHIAMIGAGYVGLVSAACFSEFGHNVICVDKIKGKIDALKRGLIPIYEPELEALVAKNAEAGRLSFTDTVDDAVKEAEVIFIAVGTPSRRGDGHADLSFVFDAALDISRAMRGYTVIVTKSTVPVGTGDEVENIIANGSPGGEFDVVSNPEFLREGSAINDFMRPDRVVIGAHTARAREVMKQIYRPLFLIETPILYTDRNTAELIKYAANTFLATKITFINEIADLCEKIGADVQDVSKGMGLDGRIGGKFLHAGPGYGGSCFPKDTLALVRTAQSSGSPLRIVETVVDVNDKRKKSLVNKVKKVFGDKLTGRKIAILGLTFKPNTDDMRDSPSLELVPSLVADGAEVRAFDPKGMDEAKTLMAGVLWAENIYDAIRGSEMVIILTEWNEFRALDLKRVKKEMLKPIMLDLRNIYDPNEMANAGFQYYSIGRPTETV